MEIRVGEFCRLFHVPAREVRYVLERGFVPAGTAEAPSTGNHRRFGPGQAFWLAMLIKLKQSGVKVPFAALIADYAVESVRTITRNLNWDWSFQPEKGEFDTEHRYLVEFADLTYVRVVTTANPGVSGLYPFDWHRIQGPRTPVKDVAPIIVLQIDMTEIARALKEASSI